MGECTNSNGDTMNSQLDLNKLSIQSLCNIMQPILGAELMVIDRSMIAVAGTGPYKKNIGSRRPRDSYVDVTLKSGQGFQIAAPGETDQCMRCEMKPFCTYTSVISCPLRYRDKIVGLFGLLGYDRNQRITMERRNLFLSNLSENIGDYIVDNFFGRNFSYAEFVTSSALDHIVNAIDKGVIITDRDNRIIKVNQFAEEALKVRREDCLGKPIDLFGDALELVESFPQPGKADAAGRSKFIAQKNPVLHHDRPVGQVLLLKNNARRQPSSTTYTFGQAPFEPRLIGASGPILDLKKILSKVAANDSRILITGETGTGKELVAQLIHCRSPRCRGPFVALNCGAIPETLIESELFGYARGAFTDARKKGKAGKFEQANGGTIFLDEIGNLSLTGQAKILRILDNDILEKIGSETAIKLDVRVICATNKNLPQMVAKGHFLEDLYYRLNVVQIEVPPLRERKTDIPLLLDFFIQENNRRFGGQLKSFTNRAMSYLIHFQWPGNVRELKNITEYACNLKTSGFADIEDLPPYMSPLRKTTGKDTPKPINTEKLMVEEALRLFGNSTAGKQEAAQYLGISVSTLYRRLNMGRAGNDDCH